MKHYIPLSVPNFEGNEEKYIVDAIRQGWVSTGGLYISKFEEKLATFLKAQKVVACQSGTAGLHLSLIEAGVVPGDIVIVPTLTFIAAVNPVKYQFADPVFIDCDDSLCMDPIKLEKFCREECELSDKKLIHKYTGKHVKALIVVHVFGNLADMDAIMNTAEKYNLKVIEDATEALGSQYLAGKYEGKFAGTIGDFGVYSFNGNKIITTGGGGAITGRKIEEINHIQYLSTQAKDDIHSYIHNEIGYNYRMTNIQAALGVAQMEELIDFIERKQKNYNIYLRLFEECEYAEILKYRKDIFSNMWLYSLKIDNLKVKVTVEDIVDELNNKGIQTRPIWGLVHTQYPYREALAYEIEKALYYKKCIFNIPCSTQIKKEEIYYVAGQIKDSIEKYVK